MIVSPSRQHCFVQFTPGAFINFVSPLASSRYSNPVLQTSGEENMRIISALLLLYGVSAANAQQSFLVDWDEAGEEAIQHLVELVQYRWNVVIEMAAAD